MSARNIYRADSFSLNSSHIFIFVFCVLAINAFVIYFIDQERYIYFWDIANYSDKCRVLRELLANSPLEAVKTLFHSIRHDEYNYLAAFFLMPFNFILGNERLSYILSITNTYAIPAAFFFSILLIQTMHSREKDSVAVFFITLLTVALFPSLWAPLLRGYPDVGGVLIISALLLLLASRSIDQSNVSQLVIIGVLLAFLVLFRRWYAYWVVSFFIAVAIESLLFLLTKHRLELKRYAPYIRNIFIIGAVSAGLFFVVSTPMAKKMLITNYADIYSAYKQNSTMQTLISCYKYFGFSFVMLSLLGVAQSLFDRNTRRIATFLLIQSIAAFFLFSRVQDFGSHHYYLFIPAMIVFISLLAISVYLRLKKRILRILILFSYIVILFLNFSVVFIPKASDYLDKIAFLLPAERHFPYFRNDINDIALLVDMLESVVRTKMDGHVYTIASSVVFNDDILRNACLSFRKSSGICGKFLSASHIDKRDGFPQQFLTSELVVVAKPIQYHLRPDDQKVVGILAELILNQKGIGKSYRRLPYEVVLSEGVRILVYERIFPFGKNDLESLSQLFIERYPDKKEIFRIDTACALIWGKKAGDVFGSVTCKKDSIFVHPGENLPSKFSLHLGRESSSIKAVFGFINPHKIPSSCPSGGGEIDLTLKSDGEVIFRRNIHHTQEVNLELNVKNVANLEFIVDKGRNESWCDWFEIRNIDIN